MDLLTWLLPDRAGVAACGLPIKRGLLNPGDRLVLTQGGLQLPLLWQVRVLWPDGSVKWIFYHTDIPCSEKLILSISPDGVPAGFPAAENKPVLMHNGWKVELCGKTVLVQNDMTYWAGKEIHSEAFSCDELEGGPIAPLFLLQSAGESGITEHLVRLYPSQGAMNVIRRVTLHSKGTQELRYSRMDLFCEGMDVVQPDEFRRTPSRVDKLENGYRIMLWPSDAGPVSLLGGISLRQTLSCGGDRTCTPLLQDGYLAGTRTLGECYFQGNDSERLLFPGFQNAYRNLLDLGTYQSLGHDNAFLGLLHDGDWPLKENQYGAAGYRCYADNEYDAALAYCTGLCRLWKGRISSDCVTMCHPYGRH